MLRIKDKGNKKKDSLRGKYFRSKILLGIGTLLMTASLYYLNRHLNVNAAKPPSYYLGIKRESEYYSSRLRKSIDDYIDEIYPLVVHPNKRIVYVLFQKHSLEDPSLSELTRRTVRHDVAQAQVSLARIIESLYLNKNLDLIVSEGIMHDIIIDYKEQKQRFRNLFFANQVLDNIYDETIRYLVSEHLTNGVNVVGFLYPGLKIRGFEEPATASTPEKLERERGSEQDFLKSIGEDRKIRSENALKYALQHSDTLYKSGEIKIKDVGVVIGLFHFIDYKDIMPRVVNGQTDYNIIFIIPKGVK